MIKKFILLVGLFTFFTLNLEANSARVIQELVTVGLSTSNGQRALSSIFRRPIGEVIGREEIAVGEASEEVVESLVQALLSIEKFEKKSISREILSRLRGSDPTLILRQIDLSSGEFSGIYMPKVSIFDSNFTSANMHKGEFAEAAFVGGKFNSAKLSEANFYKANLREVKFIDADLSGANMRKAELDMTTFTGANLSGADMRGSDLNWSTVNFDGAKYDLKTTFPLLFDPKARKMSMANGKQHGKFSYLLASRYNKSLLFQCGMGSSLGAWSAFTFTKSYPEGIQWTAIGMAGPVLAVLAPMAINGIITSDVPSQGTRVGTAYLCVAVGGSVTGTALHD